MTTAVLLLSFMLIILAAISVAIGNVDTGIYCVLVAMWVRMP